MLRTPRLTPLTVFLVAGAALGALALRTPPAAVACAVEESPLHEPMETMNAAMRFFAKTGANAENRDKALEWIAKFQSSVVTCKVMTPQTASAVPDAERAVFVTGFRRMMVDVLAASCRLEKALLDGRYDEANQIAREELKALKAAGHEKYEGEDEH